MLDVVEHRVSLHSRKDVRRLDLGGPRLGHSRVTVAAMGVVGEGVGCFIFLKPIQPMIPTWRRSAVRVDSAKACWLPVTIDDGAWLGASVSVLPGLAPNGLYGGLPAKLLCVLEPDGKLATA